MVTGYNPLFLLGRRQGIFVICDRYCIYYICVIYGMYCMYRIYRIYSIYLNSCAVKRFLVFSEIFLTWKKAFEKFSAAERRYSPSAGGRLRPRPGRSWNGRKPLPCPQVGTCFRSLWLHIRLMKGADSQIILCTVQIITSSNDKV